MRVIAMKVSYERVKKILETKQRCWLDPGRGSRERRLEGLPYTKSAKHQQQQLGRSERGINKRQLAWPH